MTRKERMVTEAKSAVTLRMSLSDDLAVDEQAIISPVNVGQHSAVAVMAFLLGIGLEKDEAVIEELAREVARRDAVRLFIPVRPRNLRCVHSDQTDYGRFSACNSDGDCVPVAHVCDFEWTGGAGCA